MIERVSCVACFLVILVVLFVCLLVYDIVIELDLDLQDMARKIHVTLSGPVEP